MFEKADSILKKTINKRGLAKTALSARICLEAENQIAKELPKFKNQITVTSFVNGILKISSESTIINQEVQLKKHILIKKINQKLKTDLVKDLRFNIK